MGASLVGALLLAGACGDDVAVPPLPLAHSVSVGEARDDVDGREAEPSTEAYRVTQVGETSTIVGRVRFRGTRPGLRPFDVPRQHDVCGHSQPNPTFAVGPAGGFSNVVVWLDLAEGASPLPPTEPLILDQLGCRYQPHITIAHPGERILFRNSDAVLHNVHAEWHDGRAWLNFGQPRLGDANVQVLSRVGVVTLRCDAGHPWTVAWLHILPHPYHAVTDAQGAFRIEAVPVGTHRVRLWHASWEREGSASGRPLMGEPVTAEAEVTVNPGEEASLELILPSSAELL